MLLVFRFAVLIAGRDFDGSPPPVEFFEHEKALLFCRRAGTSTRDGSVEAYIIQQFAGLLVAALIFRGIAAAFEDFAILPELFRRNP